MAQATTIDEFMTAVKTTLMNLAVFAVVWDMPGMDPARLLGEPRFPAATINDDESIFDPNTGDFIGGTLAVTVIVDDFRDNAGEYAQGVARGLGDQVITALKARTDLCTMLRVTRAISGNVNKDGALVLVFRTYFFKFEIQRA